MRVWAVPLGHMPRRSVGRHVVPNVLVAYGQVGGSYQAREGRWCYVGVGWDLGVRTGGSLS